MPAMRLLRAVLLGATGTYAVSVVPGVRAVAGHSLVWDVGVYNLVAGLALVMCVLRAVRQPAARVTWTLLAVGLACYTAGLLVFTVWLQPMEHVPYPSVADGLWLTFYPLALTGIGLATRTRIVGSSTSVWLDGLVAGLGLAAMGSAVLFNDVTVAAVGSLTGVVGNLAYPVLDLSLAACVVGAMAATRDWTNRTWLALALAFVALAVADSVFLVQVAADSYRAGSPVDAVWVVAICLVGVAASAHPTPSVATAESRSFLVPAISAAGSVVVLAADAVVVVPASSTVLALAALAAAFGRSALAVREVVALADSRKQARTDPLTGLPNRRMLYELLEEPAAGRAPSAALLLIDLDRFKEVNDALGHRTGDRLLRAVAHRLSGRLPAGATLSRLGGDEFAVLLPGVDGPAAQEFAEGLRARLQEPFSVGGMTLHVDASIGVTSAGAATDADRDLARADVAMYRAKASRSGVESYDDQRDGDAWDRLALVEDIRTALDGGDLHLELQPIVSLPSGRPTAVEALVRWTHPVRGRLAPDEFLPMVERAGLMWSLTRYVLDRALDQAVALRDAGRPVPVAVNLSASDLLDHALVDVVAGGLAHRGLPGAALHLEVTESLLVENRDVGDAILRRLRALGVAIAVDDFGTGYSSLTYLRDLPVDQLKIDRSFVSRLGDDPRTATIVASTITLARDLGLQVVAEGVETREQLDWLTRHGCGQVQGYLLGRPMTAAGLDDWLDDRRDDRPDDRPDRWPAGPGAGAVRDAPPVTTGVEVGVRS